MPRDLPPELDVFLVLHLAAGAAWPLIQREFEAEGVSPGNWGLLVHVGARGRMTPSDLATENGGPRYDGARPGPGTPPTPDPCGG